MEHEKIEIFSKSINCPVMRIPGRKFPGVLIQGDSLKCLLGMVEDIDQARISNDIEELQESILILKNKIIKYLEEYESIMKINGMDLPYVK